LVKLYRFCLITVNLMSLSTSKFSGTSIWLFLLIFFALRAILKDHFKKLIEENMHIHITRKWAPLLKWTPLLKSRKNLGVRFRYCLTLYLYLIPINFRHLNLNMFPNRPRNMNVGLPDLFEKSYLRKVVL
jgi:hypothetical protein